MAPVFHFNSAVNQIALGDNDIAEAYIGDNLVYQKSAPPSNWDLVFEDNFGAADGYNIGDEIINSPAWENAGGNNNLQQGAVIESCGLLRHRGLGNDFTDRSIQYTGDATEFNQAIEWTLSDYTLNERIVMLLSVLDSSGIGNQRSDCITFFWDPSGTYTIRESTGGSVQRTVTLPDLNPQQNDVYRLEVDGGVARVLVNGVQAGDTMTGITKTGTKYRLDVSLRKGTGDALLRDVVYTSKLRLEQKP